MLNVRLFLILNEETDAGESTYRRAVSYIAIIFH